MVYLNVQGMSVLSLLAVGTVGFGQSATVQHQDRSSRQNQALAMINASGGETWSVKPMASKQLRASTPATVSVKQLLHQPPGKAASEYDKGEKARIEGRVEEAIAHFNKAIKLDPEFVGARNNAAALYMVHGQPAAAIDVLEPATKMDPHNPLPFSNLAVAYMMTKRLDAAEHAARQTLRIDNSNLRSKMILGLALVMQQKGSNEALVALRGAEDDYPQAHLLQARIFAGRGSVTQAIGKVEAYLATGDASGRELAESWLRVLRNTETVAAATQVR